MNPQSNFYTPEGETRPLPNPDKIMITSGVKNWLEKEDFQVTLFDRIIKKEWAMQPDICTDGGNDKYFFSFISRKQKFFAAANEVNGLTVMLPEEY